jgi:hypothetical protein
MASQLSIQDKELINTHIKRFVGDRPYENGKFGTQSTDFTLFELRDNGVFKNLPSGTGFTPNTVGKININPATHIKDCGYDSGTFKVRYQFLRKLAGDDTSVLTRTNPDHIGEIYDNLSNIYITDDGEVFLGSQEEFENSQGQLELLKIEDYKYQIDEISPSRTEIRLKAKDIKGAYQQDFIKLQESVIFEELSGTVDFGASPNTSTTIQLYPNDDFFPDGFTPNMVGGTISIPNIFKTGEEIHKTKSEGNFLPNADFEELKYTSPTFVVSSINLTNPGSGYADGATPTVSITGGGGSGASAMAIVINGSVLAITLTSGGSGYTSKPSVSVSGNAQATSNISAEGGEEIITINSDEISEFGGHTYNLALHPNAVRPVGWRSAFWNWQPYGSSWNGFYDPEIGADGWAKGYQAYFASNEGVEGGVCMKFPDLNLGIMEDLVAEWQDALNEAETYSMNIPLGGSAGYMENWYSNNPRPWPETNPHGGGSRGLLPEQRFQRLVSDYLDPIQMAAMKVGDEINISFDIKSTVLGKGVNVYLSRFQNAHGSTEHRAALPNPHQHSIHPIHGPDNPIPVSNESFGPSSVPSTAANEWERKELTFVVDSAWLLDMGWRIYFYGHMTGREQGITWVDNVEINFTYTDQTIIEDILEPYAAKITNVVNPLTIHVDKSFDQVRDEVYNVVQGGAISNPFATLSNTNGFEKMNLNYIVNNAYDLRTYLKFDNDLFLTTNFKSDKVTVSEYPYSIVYKLYQPLPSAYEELDECTVVKEMADAHVDSVRIVDFVDTEITDTVLKTPDIFNSESPVSRRSTPYESETAILTDDESISNKLRNEFLSQSFASVELNTDYSRYENFINFSSARKRISNFKTKLRNIESYKIASASYENISGSLKDIRAWETEIDQTKNNFDPFEKYMYYESSSYFTSSLGEYFDNAWPKANGTGTIRDPYTVAHTTSSQATTWFDNAMISSSEYDYNNSNKLSNNIPAFIVNDSGNKDYIQFTDMIGQHFDSIWVYINSMSDTFDRRQKLDEGISKELLYTVAKSLGWSFPNAKDLVDLPRYAYGVQVTGSAFSDYSAIADRDISREIWSRIIANMPFFLKNKGTVRALKGLINIYGIPSTILRVKEYGGPNLPDDATPQFEVTRKFTRALDFRGFQSVKTAWSNDIDSSRKPDTVEFRFRAVSSSNQILVEKQDVNNQDWFIRLKDNGSTDNIGSVSFMLSGSAAGVAQGQYKEISSSAFPVYDGDFYSVMVRRLSGSDGTPVSQSYNLSVGKYDSSRSKIHLYSTTTMDVTQAASASFNSAWTGSGDIYIGGSGSAGVSDVGSAFTGSIMEYRHWTETLNTGSFKNHIGNPKAYDGNTVSSSYNNLVLRYSFNDNKDLTSDTEGIRDVSSNQTTTVSGSHFGFTDNFFRTVVDELKSNIPSIGALRRTNNKIRIEANNLKPGYNLNATTRATEGVYDTAPLDSNKVGIFFAPTDVINNDIINSVADLNFDNYLGDPRDLYKLDYRGLKYVANNYWKKYNSPNNFWDYIRLIKYYDQSMFPQLKKMVPARAKARVGVLIEPNIFERPKINMNQKPNADNFYYSASINATDAYIKVTGSFNIENTITDYNAYTDVIKVYAYDSSSVLTVTGSFPYYEGSSSQAADMFINTSMWQRLNVPGLYSDTTMSFGDTLNGAKEVLQPIISGSRMYGRNQKIMRFYSTQASASQDIAHSSSYYNVDLDTLAEQHQATFNMFYAGVKNTHKTTWDGGDPVEYIVTSPTKLVTTEMGDSSLKTGQGKVSQFAEAGKFTAFEQQQDIETDLGALVTEGTFDTIIDDGATTPPDVTPKDTMMDDPPNPVDDTIDDETEAPETFNP